MKETKSLEFKEKITNTFLKTVSAFANYTGGEIRFGISNKGIVKGFDDVEETCLVIENMINVSIKPTPDFTIKVNEDTTISLIIEAGQDKPYFYKSKSYKRNDTSTVEMSVLELKRLILAGYNRSYDGLVALNQNLTFHFLSTQFNDQFGVKTLNQDLLTTLMLYDRYEGYTIAAELFSDQGMNFGIDIAKFGEDINVIEDRLFLSSMSILEQYQLAIKKYRQYYQYDKIEGSLRNTYERIPETAFREAIANALVHRTWDVNANIRVLMFDNYIEITSPGGLPDNITEADYLESRMSSLRNPIVADIFFRLHMIERLGTGVKRILKMYRESKVQPTFSFTDTSIQVTLPVLEFNYPNLESDEDTIYKLLVKEDARSSYIINQTGFGKTKAVQLLNGLVNKGYVMKQGNGRGTTYKVKR